MKRYGQHFLIDESVRDAIIAASGAGRDDLVIEIGPGKGALTHELAGKAGILVAVEIDHTLAEQLKQVYDDRSDVFIVHGDILECDIERLIEDAIVHRSGRKPERCKVVANLPYYITTPVLRMLLHYSSLFSELVLMVQLEVAERLIASAGDSSRSVLSLLAQYYTEPSIVMHIGPQCFSPPPLVDSAVVRLAVRPTPPVSADEPLLFKLVEAGFAQRRKTIRNAISASGIVPGGSAQVGVVLERAGIDGKLRAEQLSLDQFAALARACAR